MVRGLAEDHEHILRLLFGSDQVRQVQLPVSLVLLLVFTVGLSVDVVVVVIENNDDIVGSAGRAGGLPVRCFSRPPSRSPWRLRRKLLLILRFLGLGCMQEATTSVASGHARARLLRFPSLRTEIPRYRAGGPGRGAAGPDRR